MSNKEIQQLIHAIRGDLTLHKFSEDSTKQTVIETTADILSRFELTMQHEDGIVLHPVDLKQILKECIRGFDEPRIDIQYCCDVAVQGNSELTGIIIHELVQNALNFSDGAVYVSTHKTDSMAVVRIEDEGPGIPNNVQAHIAEPFVAGDSVEKGKGLGLAIAWSLIQAHDGNMTILTTEGEGTTVFVTLNIVND